MGIGDDGALISIGAGMQIAISADMLVSGTHFFADADPYATGWKSLAVNISDMAAMGANPKWATLAIALPHNDAAWLAQFSAGFFACAQAFHVVWPLTTPRQILLKYPSLRWEVDFFDSYFLLAELLQVAELALVRANLCGCTKKADWKNEADGQALLSTRLLPLQDTLDLLTA